jgi:quercetin dioxygenase-like cupin family protein
MKSICILILTLVFSLQAEVWAQHHSAPTESLRVTDTVILRQLLKEPGLKNKEVQMLIVDFPPGIISAPHRHPCQTFGYLLEGELESEFEGKKYVYKKGDSFYEMPNGLHRLTRNPSNTETAKLLVFFITDKGKATSILEKNNY